MVSRIVEIVKEASNIMLKREFDVEQKGNLSNLVTSADVAVQTFLKDRLTRLVEGSVFLGEEGEIPDTDVEYLWVNDPIDGTANFARDMGLSVISVALIKDGKPYIGVIYHPYRDECFTAIKGEGAYLNGRRIYVSDRPFERGMLCSAMSLYEKRYAKQCFNIIEKVYAEADDLRRLGTAALELCELACGRVDLYFEARLSIWDYAAGMLIITEAGGYVEVMFEDELQYSRPAGFIAANNEENFNHLKEIVYSEIPERLLFE